MRVAGRSRIFEEYKSFGCPFHAAARGIHPDRRGSIVVGPLGNLSSSDLLREPDAITEVEAATVDSSRPRSRPHSEPDEARTTEHVG